MNGDFFFYFRQVVAKEDRLVQLAIDFMCLNSRTHSAGQAPLWSSLVTCVVYCLRVRQCSGFVSLFSVNGDFLFYFDQVMRSILSERRFRFLFWSGD